MIFKSYNKKRQCHIYISLLVIIVWFRIHRWLLNTGLETSRVNKFQKVRLIKKTEICLICYSKFVSVSVLKVTKIVKYVFIWIIIVHYIKYKSYSFFSVSEYIVYFYLSCGLFFLKFKHTIHVCIKRNIRGKHTALNITLHECQKCTHRRNDSEYN